MSQAKIDPRNLHISSLKGLGAAQVDLFKTKGVSSIEDLLLYLPMRYEERTSSLSLADAYQKQMESETYTPTLVAQCLAKKEGFFQGRSVPKFTFQTNSGETFFLTAFNPYHRFLKEGRFYILIGKLKTAGKIFNMNLIEYEAFDEDAVESINQGRIVPIYSSTEGLFQKKIRQSIAAVLDSKERLDYPYLLPKSLVKKYNLKDKLSNLKELHFPESFESLNQARDELSYEELFAFEYELTSKKLAAQVRKEPGRYAKEEITEKLVRERLPFKLTEEQERVLKEIKDNLRGLFTMTRLIQGDVGSGKTIVCLFSMLLARDNGKQSVLLAPTDLLAKQHYRLFFDLLLPLGVNVSLLVGGMSAANKKEALRQIRSGESDLIVGTHALFQEDVKYFNLKYVVIDEQHRFGVEQRQALINKGDKPDILMTSATPIPRSLAMTLFGDLDISTIAQVPEGMGKRKAKVVYEEERERAYQFLASRVKKGEQAYVVFPAIEEKTSALKALVKESKNVKERYFATTPVGVLHGRLSEEERNKTMQLFIEGKIFVLFATTIVEVGVNNPNATTMIVESAEAFGLSQLHQLRGRVGRGQKEGYCYLVIKREKSIEIKERLKKFCETESGFDIAELDLKTRGTGDFFGTRQSGQFKLRIADVVRDFEILKRAKNDAAEMFVKELEQDGNKLFH